MDRKLQTTPWRVLFPASPSSATSSADHQDIPSGDVGIRPQGAVNWRLSAGGCWRPGIIPTQIHISGFLFSPFLLVCKGSCASPVLSQGQHGLAAGTYQPDLQFPHLSWSSPFSDTHQGPFSVPQAPGLQFCSCILRPVWACSEKILFYKCPIDCKCLQSVVHCLPSTLAALAVLAAMPTSTLAMLRAVCRQIRPAGAETTILPDDTVRCCHSRKL